MPRQAERIKTTTLRMAEDRLRLLRAIAGYEDRTMTEIMHEMIELYIAQHKETLALIGIPGFAEECREGLEEIRGGGGKRLGDLGR